MKTGIELIAQERQEQIEKHGRTIEKDVEYNHGKYTDHNGEQINNPQLTAAARWLIHDDVMKYWVDQELFRPFGWDRGIWSKMINKTYKERLIISGALIAAEIDRLQNT